MSQVRGKGEYMTSKIVDVLVGGMVKGRGQCGRGDNGRDQP